MLVDRTETQPLLLIRIIDDAGEPITGIIDEDDVDEELSVALFAHLGTAWSTLTLTAGAVGTYTANTIAEIGAGIYQLCLASSAITPGGVTLIRVVYAANIPLYDAIVARGGTDWTAAERSQIRYRLGLDGTRSAPTEADPTLPVTVTTTAIISVDSPTPDSAGRFEVIQRDDYEDDDDIAPIGPIRIETTQDLLREESPPTLLFFAKQSIGRRFSEVVVEGTAYAVAVTGEANQYDIFIEVTSEQLNKIPGEYGWDVKAVYSDEDRSTLVHGTMLLRESMDLPPVSE